MAEREKVIRGLESLWKCISPVCHTCGDCPYQDNRVECRRRVVTDALSLMKEQEARVMTREEVIHSKDWIWYQWKNTHCGWMVAVNCDGKWIEWEDSTTDQLCEYGKKWRCWTSRPSPEQMRDTPWEETKNG